RSVLANGRRRAGPCRQGFLRRRAGIFPALLRGLAAPLATLRLALALRAGLFGLLRRLLDGVLLGHQVALLAVQDGPNLAGNAQGPPRRGRLAGVGVAGAAGVPEVEVPALCPALRTIARWARGPVPGRQGCRRGAAWSRARADPGCGCSTAGCRPLPLRAGEAYMRGTRGKGTEEGRACGRPHTA